MGYNAGLEVCMIVNGNGAKTESTIQQRPLSPEAEDKNPCNGVRQHKYHTACDHSQRSLAATEIRLTASQGR